MNTDHAHHRAGHDEHDTHSRLALAWHGFGSPVGLGLLAISLGVTAVLLRTALLGDHMSGRSSNRRQLPLNDTKGELS